MRENNETSGNSSYYTNTLDAHTSITQCDVASLNARRFLRDGATSSEPLAGFVSALHAAGAFPKRPSIPPRRKAVRRQEARNHRHLVGSPKRRPKNIRIDELPKRVPSFAALLLFGSYERTSN